MIKKKSWVKIMHILSQHNEKSILKCQKHMLHIMHVFRMDVTKTKTYENEDLSPKTRS